MSSTDILANPGEIILDSCKITSLNAATEVDITPIIQSISLYEDLFSNSMTGQILIEDAIELLTELPLVGEEIIDFQCHTPTLSSEIKKKFFIYKIDNRKTNKRSQSYLIHICSVELITNLNTKFSKSFGGTISDSVKKIFTEDNYLASQQELIIEETKNSLNFITAYWTPFKTINWLCEKSIAQSGSSNYVFYETNKGYEFCTLSKLASTQHIRDYTYADVDSNTFSEYDIEKKYSFVKSIETDLVFDYIKNNSSGMYASTLYTLDTTTKNINKKNYDYIQGWSDDKHLNTMPLNTSSVISKNSSSVHHIHQNSYLYGTKHVQSYGESFLRRNSTLQQFSSFRMNITVHGRTDIKIGDTIKFETPVLKEILTDDILEAADKSRYTGRYLITAIRHNITQGYHEMKMEITTDSFSR